MLQKSVPIFAVKDVRETVAFYRDVLGFAGEWFWGDPASFAGATWGDVQVMFNQQPDLAQKLEGHQHHYWADEIEALHARHAAAGAPIISPIENKPWGIREYTIRDPNGYHLRFSGPAEYQRPANASDTLPPEIQIIERLATWQEYLALKQSVGWETEAAPDILDRSTAGVVAVDTQRSQVVGMARAMCDARGWYSVWDVIVRPEYQSRRIGTAMMERLLAALRELGPAGSFVFLFTMRQPFYERLGFRTEKVTMMRL